MEANFFKQLNAIDFAGSVQLTIARGVQGSLIVSVLPHNEGCADKAKNLIRPLTLRGGAAEMDASFFEHIAAPLAAASGLMVDMQGYMQHLETVKKQSEMEKEKQGKEKKQQDAKGKKYSEAMQRAAELEAEGKYREAWAKVPNPADYPEQAEELRSRRAQLSEGFENEGLFGQAQQTAIVEP